VSGVSAEGPARAKKSVAPQGDLRGPPLDGRDEKPSSKGECPSRKDPVLPTNSSGTADIQREQAGTGTEGVEVAGPQLCCSASSAVDRLSCGTPCMSPSPPPSPQVSIDAVPARASGERGDLTGNMAGLAGAVGGAHHSGTQLTRHQQRQRGMDKLDLVADKIM